MKKITIKLEKNRFILISKFLNLFFRKRRLKNYSSNIVFVKNVELSPQIIKYRTINEDKINSNTKILQNALKKYNNYARRNNSNKYIFYFIYFFILPLCLLFFFSFIYIKNSIFLNIVLAYEHKFLSFENVINLSSEPDLITFLSVEEGITMSEYTTGVKVVGERAYGKISVFNATAEVIVINEGTKVVCISSRCNGKEFLAKHSLNLGPGSAYDLEIVASDIGEEFNIPINAGRFKIGNFNPNQEIVASNIRPIQGGTPKKTVMIVSKDDIERLKLKALDALKSMIKSKIITDPNNSNNYIFFREAEAYLNNDIYVDSDKEGDEKDILNMTVRGSGKVQAIYKNKIDPKIKDFIKEMTPEGYYFDEKSLNYSVSAFYNKHIPMLEIKLNGIGRLIVDIDHIKSEIKQKHLNDAVRILNQFPNLKLLEFTYSPTFIPNEIRFVPDDIDRIRIQVIALDPTKSGLIKS